MHSSSSPAIYRPVSAKGCGITTGGTAAARAHGAGCQDGGWGGAGIMFSDVDLLTAITLVHLYYSDTDGNSWQAA